MPAYVTLVKFTPEGLKNIDDIGKAFEEGRKMAEEMGIKPIGAYATLGPYDMMLIYEAPDEKVAAGMSMSLRGQTETWTLIPMEEFTKLASSF
jgi:uncharacterized protein with GYD domain